MITAVDTSVLLDLFTANQTHGQRSKKALQRGLREGRVVACEIVFAEVAAAFPSGEAARAALTSLGIGFEPMGVAAALFAGEVFKAYRARGGKRDRVIADFLIGAHAIQCEARLLTRDRGFHRTYFSELELMDPSSDDV